MGEKVLARGSKIILLGETRQARQAKAADNYASTNLYLHTCLHHLRYLNTITSS